MRSIRFFLYAIPAALLLLFATAFWKTTFLSTKKKNEMSLGLPAGPTTLNPIEQSDFYASTITALIFNGLLKTNENLDLVGDLASSWSLSQTSTEPIISFTLRHDVCWQDGVPFTAADVLFTYHFVMDDRVISQLRSYFELISKIEAPDPWHVIVHYRHPFSPALLSWTTSILPAHLLEGKDPRTLASSFDRHPIGTGPFCFDSWKENEYVRLKRNDHYFLGKPWLDSIVFRILPDPLTMRLAFETHQIDFWSAPPWAIKTFLNDPRFELFTAPSNAYDYIGWNLHRPFFEDLSVRQALAQAVNIPEIIHYIFYGNGVQSTGIFLPQSWFFDPSIKQLSYDPEQACRLLDQAGWRIGPDGIRQRHGERFSFKLLTVSGSDNQRDIAALLKNEFKKIGIEVNIEVYEWTVFTQHLMKHDFDAVLGAWAIGAEDFDHYAVWHSSQSHPGELNYVSYNNPRVDTLITEMRQEYSHPKIIQLAAELQQTIYNDQPYLFLFVPNSTSILWKGDYRLCYPTDHGFVDSPLKTSKAGWNYNLEWFYRREYPPNAIHQKVNSKLKG